MCIRDRSTLKTFDESAAFVKFEKIRKNKKNLDLIINFDKTYTKEAAL